MSDEEKKEVDEWSDWEGVKEKTLSPRARRFCQHLATGMKQGEAAKKVGYSQSRASIIANQDQAKEYIEKCQEKIFEMSVVERIKELGGPAVDIIENIMLSDDPSIKPQTKMDAAKWVAEQIKGKAKQEVEHTGNVTHEIWDKLEKLEQSGQVIDVSPEKRLEIEASKGKEVTERDKLDHFLDFEADELEK